MKTSKQAKEQLTLEERKQLAYQELMRYMDNVEALLKKAGKLNEEYYRDPKYVHTASGTAYIAAIKALGCLCELLGVVIVPLPQEPPKDGKQKQQRRPHINDYLRAAEELGEILGDPTLREKLRTIYSLLHLSGYYDGTLNIRAIRNGLDIIYSIIEYLRPDNPLPPLPPLPLPPSNPFVGALRQVIAFLWPFRLP